MHWVNELQKLLKNCVEQQRKCFTENSSMPYPTILTAIEKNTTIFIPDPVSLKSTYETLKSNDNSTSFPFWAKIWPSAKAMTVFLQNNLHNIESKKVLEIGAGIGLPSFSIASQATELIISDYSNDAIKLIQKNIDHLKLTNTKALYLDWNDFPLEIKADTILLSDTNYDPTQIDPLLKLINHYLANGTTIIISTPERITANPFVNELQQFIKYSCLQRVEEAENMIEIRILVL